MTHRELVESMKIIKNDNSDRNNRKKAQNCQREQMRQCVKNHSETELKPMNTEINDNITK